MANAPADNTTPNPVKPPKPHARLEKWIWILIYGGLFLVILGIATGRAEPVIGWSMAVPGGVIALVGFALIYVRSRLDDK
ncbi:uncharacterized membrane protein YhaH (DUF805 family) [Variovorax paradoxus]|uniref:hypothetical protein n=1 Tax=Variovorax paradoxus TaxID=34073 RepID=UPI0027868F51|nr:hypothetical protein [Variovorax paradoxus]MDQ0025615.1 uncharacterized membrane protein YhaH (DUF805 family) [Variovorax paradoxus]